MAKRRRVVEEEEFDEEEEEERPKAPRRPSGPRMSVTLPARARKRVKLAAALADLEVGEWCKIVLAQAAKKTVAKAFPHLDDDNEEEDDG